MLKNVGSNWALAFIQIVVLIQLKPVQVEALGVDAQGAWLTVASMTNVLSLLILGVPLASVRFIAKHVATGDDERANEAIASCLGICLLLGGGAIVGGAGLFQVFEHVYLRSPVFQRLGPELLGEARLAFWLAVLQVGLGFAGQLPFGILEAHHDFLGRNGVKIAGLLLRLGLTVGVLRHHPSLLVLAGIQLAVMIAEFCVARAIIKRRWPKIRFDLARFDRSRVREILGFSVFAMLLSLGSQLSFQADQMVISAFVTPAQGTFFDVGNTFFPPLIGILVGIGSVVMPTAAKLQATGDAVELRRVFLRWSKASYSIALLVGVYLLVLGPRFIAWWMGPSFAAPSGRVTRILMVSFLIFLPVRGVASPILLGLGKPAQAAGAFVAMGVVNLALSLVLVKPFGILGVALGTAIPCAVFALVLAWQACRELGIPVGYYLVHVFGRPTLGAVPAAALLVWLERSGRAFHAEASGLAAFVPLVCAGLGMVVVFGLVWVTFVYRDDPFVALPARLARLLRGRV